MKCDDCFDLLEEYIDGEAAERDAARVSAHLITCAACTQEFEALTAQREVYARYDREIVVSPALWNAIAARTVEQRAVDKGSRFSFGEWLAGLSATPRYAFGGTAAVVVLALMIGFVFLRTRTSNTPTRNETIAVSPRSTQAPNPGGSNLPTPSVSPSKNPKNAPDRQVDIAKSTNGPRTPRPSNQRGNDVIFTDASYTDIEDKETSEHVAQAENLLRSVRSIQFSDDDQEVDVSYEKAESRRLLDDNVVLRRDAEMAGKFPAKQLLGELEPFLIDIANLPDKATPTDLRAIKDRVQKTEIVAALRSY